MSEYPDVAIPGLDAWAKAAAAFDKPVVIRFAHEMNGVWYSWSEGAWGNQPGDYVKTVK